MIYRIGVFNFITNEIVFEYKFLKNPNNIKYSRKHITFSNEVLSGWLNFEWGLEQQKLAVNVNMPFLKGYKSNPQEDAKFFMSKLEYVVDSRQERWFFGKRGELYIGFVIDANYDKKAENPNAVGFSLNFLVDEYYKNYSNIVKKLSDTMFTLKGVNTIRGFKEQLFSQVNDKIRKVTG